MFLNGKDDISSKHSVLAKREKFPHNATTRLHQSREECHKETSGRFRTLRNIYDEVEIANSFAQNLHHRFLTRS